MPKRYTGGVTDFGSTDPAAALGVLDPSKYDLYIQSWNRNCPDVLTTLGNNTGYSGAWFYSGTDTNWACSFEQDAGVNGANISMTAGANDNGGGLIQELAYMAMTSGKKFFLETRFEVTAATIADTEIFIGLSTLCAAEGFANWVAADGLSFTHDDAVGFYTLDASADLVFTSREADAATTLTTKSTMVTATWYKASAYYDGTDWFVYLDDTLVGTVTPAQIPVTPVVPSFFYRAGKAEAQTLKIDYLHVISEK